MQTLNREKAIRYYRRAMQLISETQVLPVPRNFQLFFEYAEGSNRSLIAALDALLLSNSKPAPSEIDLLYEHYLTGAADGAHLEQMGDRLSREIRGALGVVRDAASSTEEFSSSVSEVEGALNNCADAEAVRQGAAILRELAHEMSRQSAEMNARLSQAAEQIDGLKGALDEVRLEAQKDALTGVANRKSLDRKLREEIEEAEASGHPLSLCMVDVDNFKRFNDEHGHRAGDAALRVVAGLFRHGLREYDLVARYGGEEFVMVMPNAELKTAISVAERIREALAAKEIVRRTTGEKLGFITVSVGVATWHKGDTSETLIERADQALYRAKGDGRNRVKPEVYEPPGGDETGRRVA